MIFCFLNKVSQGFALVQEIKQQSAFGTSLEVMSTVITEKTTALLKKPYSNQSFYSKL